MRVGAVVAVLVGCGAPHHPNLPDSGAPPDAPLDAFDPRVKITVADSNGPMQGIRVFFQNADSSVVLATDTDSDGIARTEMQPGGFVTAVLPATRTHHEIPRDDLYTFAGVEPGDQLRVGNAQTQSPSIDLIVPADPTAVGHALTTSCLEGGWILLTPPTTHSVPQCQSAMDVLVVSSDASNAPKAALFQPAVASAGPLTAPYLPVQDSNLSFANIGAARSLFARETLVTEGGAQFSTTSQVTDPGTSVNMTFRVPQLPDSRQIVETGTSEVMGVRGVVEWGAPGPYAVDLDAVALPRFASMPVFDGSTHTVSWTEQPSSTTPNAVVIALISTPDVAVPPGHRWLWKLAAPRTGTAVAFPTLPIETVDYNTTMPETTGLYETTTLQASGGYDAVRARLLLDGSTVLDPSTLVSGTDGRIVYQGLPD